MICQTAFITRPISGFSDANSEARRPSARAAAPRARTAPTPRRPPRRGSRGTRGPRRRAGGYGGPARRRPRSGPRPRAGRWSGRPSRARSPGAVGALGDLLDHLVAVHRLRRRAPRGSPPARRRGVPVAARRTVLAGEPDSPVSHGGGPDRRFGDPHLPKGRPTRPPRPRRLRSVLVEQRLEVASQEQWWPIDVSSLGWRGPLVDRSRYIASVRDPPRHRTRSFLRLLESP